MEFENFNTGNHFSIGAELEIRILDKLDLTPKNEFDFLISNLDEKFSKNVAKEFLSSMLEINTPVFNHEEELISYLKEIISKLSSIASKKNLCLQTSGTFAQDNSHIQINNDDRYKKIYDEHKILLENFSICGTHVHIGFENFQKALNAYNYSIYYLPLFVALSASSVYHNNIDTGIHSYRTKIFERLPKASIPEYYDSYEDMKAIYDLLYKSKVIKSTKDIWWDVRIQPHFKTVEFRVCDAINDFDRLEVCIGLFKAICQLSQIEKYERIPMQILKQNMWSATRYSMDGQMLTKDAKVVSIRQMLKDIVNKAYKNSFLSKQLKEKCEKVIEKNSIAQDMIDIYNRTKNLKEVEKLGVFE